MSPDTNQNLDDPRLQELLSKKIAAATALLRQAAGDFAPAAFANSLGAEDMVLTDMVAKEGLEIEIFSLDTGRLPPETHDLMRTMQEHYNIELHLYAPRPDLLEAFVGKEGEDAFYKSVELRKACCHVRKVEPLQRALKGKKAWITGMRAQQAVTRSGLQARHFDEANGLEKFNPLHDWSEDETWAYIRMRAVPYNELHDKNFPSIGCAPCTRAVKAGEDTRAGRWWWEEPQHKECGLHDKNARS